MPTNEELQAADLALQAQITEMRDDFARHELEHNEWALWRKDVEKTIEELRALQRNQFTKADGAAMEKRLSLDAQTTPTAVVQWFVGGFVILALLAVFSHLF